LASIATGCASLPRENIGHGVLEGRVLVEWDQEDEFIYRIRDNNPLRFTPSFMTDFIVPQEMYTDGGAFPRVFWSIPGLSPWGLGPAYVIHDWLFYVHRCKFPAPEHEINITFDQSAIILAEVGLALIEKGLIKHDLLDEIMALERGMHGTFWKRPGDSEVCKPAPAALRSRAERQASTIVDFTIP
jgi:hypothetical protein